MGRIPVAAHAEIVAAGVVVEIVVEAAQLSVLKAHAGETGAAGNRRCHHFHDDADAPLFVTQVIDLIADAQVKPLAFARGERDFSMRRLKCFSVSVDIWERRLGTWTAPSPRRRSLLLANRAPTYREVAGLAREWPLRTGRPLRQQNPFFVVSHNHQAVSIIAAHNHRNRLQ